MELFATSWESQGTLNYDNTINHDWELIAYSVRWSHHTPRSKSDQLNNDIVLAFRQAGR